MVGVPSSMGTPSQSHAASRLGVHANQDPSMRLNEQQQQSLSQMRSSINEKRLLVKLLKANNLASES